MSDTIAAGPELDALVAQMVMGLVPCTNSHGGQGRDYLGGRCYASPEDPADGGELPLYSTTYEGMGLVLAEMARRGFLVRIVTLLSSDGDQPVETLGWSVLFTKYREGGASGSGGGDDVRSLPEAVARAALAAVEAQG